MAAYKYDPLPDQRIRLIGLLPGQRLDPLLVSIFEADFPRHADTTPAYEALSYVWGDGAGSHSVSVVPAGADDITSTTTPTPTPTVSLGANLHSALCHLRLETSRRILWCDRLCIDQANHDERARQVARMADVYQRAQKVIV